MPTQTTVSLQALLKKTEHYDKDERYMATSDLCTLLQRHAAAYSSTPSSFTTSSSSSTASSSYHTSSSHHNTLHHHHQHQQQNQQTLILDTATERRICTAILALLDDSSNDVQTITVKTLGVLLTIVHEDQVAEISERLCSLCIDKSKSELRDVYAIGLQTLVKTVPERMGDVVSHRLTGRLLEGLRPTVEPDVTLCCLDVLSELLQRFGDRTPIRRDHERLLSATLRLCLGDGTNVVTKRASGAVAHLAVVISDGLLTQLVETLLEPLERETRGGGDARALIRTMCKISEKVGHRLAGQIDRIVPLFLRFCDPKDAVTADDESHDEHHHGAAGPMVNELRESCFSGFESFVLRCPKEVNPHLKDIVQAALAYVRYDPNYSYGDDEGEGIEEEEEEDGYSDDEFSDESDVDDDDDDSWKVRRSAVRALIAVVECSKAEPSCLWTDEYNYGSKKKTVAGALVDRFKEREEECRIYIIDCFTRLLSLTVAASTAGAIILTTTTTTSSTPMDTSSTDLPSSPVVINLYETFVPAIITACEKQLSSQKGGERTKSSALSLLATLCRAPGGIGDQESITSVLTHIRTILAGHGTPKSLKLDALHTVRVLLSCHLHSEEDVRPGVNAILPAVATAVTEDWYKVIAAALRALAEVPRFVSDDPALPAGPTADVVYKALRPRLAASDLDQEIKECALGAAASLLSAPALHKTLSEETLQELLRAILERLKNETTRMAALKTLSQIAAAEGLDLGCILEESVGELAQLARQKNRALKQSSLEALDVVIRNHGGGLSVQLFDVVLKEFGPIIVDSDLHISHLALRTCISILKVCPAAAPSVKTHILPPSLALAVSPLLQDLALDSLLSLLSQLVAINAIDFTTLHSSLLSQLSDHPNKQSLGNLAKSIAAITAATTPANRNRVVSDLISAMETPNKDQVQIHLALLTSGELGRRVDLSSTTNVAQRLLQIYLQFFESPSEEMKHAAAYALGRASIGAMSVFLPAILTTLEEISQRKQYLLLSALKELMKSINPSDLSAEDVEQILPHLLNHCADAEEGVRTMVAECLGSLTCLRPQSTLPPLEALVTEHSGKDGPPYTYMCWTAATSIKFAIANKVSPDILSPYFPKFLSLLSSPSLSVQSAALIMVYSAVHHTPHLVSNVMKEHILTPLFELAQLNLKRVVDLGPFKHTVDDALPLRKSSLSIVATSLENCPSCLDIPAFLPILSKALEDVEDVQLQAHHIVVTLSVHFPDQIVFAADMFVDPLEKTMMKKKGNKTGTELERENEWIKSALRVLVALSRMEGVMVSSKKVGDFVERVKGNPRLKVIWESVVEEV